jgi:hypothetical protein
MKGNLYKSTPPGYLTVSEVCERLGMSRQNFHQSGLAEALDRWRVSRTTTLYRREDIGQIQRWLFVRQGLVALGLRSPKYPLNPDDSEFLAAVEEGEWDQACPGCDGDAVGPFDGPIWCPNCGVIEVEP